MVVLELEGHHSVALEWDCQEGALTVANWHLSLSSLLMPCRGASAVDGLSFASQLGGTQAGSGHEKVMHCDFIFAKKTFRP